MKSTRRRLIYRPCNRARCAPDGSVNSTDRLVVRRWASGGTQAWPGRHARALQEMVTGSSMKHRRSRLFSSFMRCQRVICDILFWVNSHARRAAFRHDVAGRRHDDVVVPIGIEIIWLDCAIKSIFRIAAGVASIESSTRHGHCSSAGGWPAFL